MATGDRGVDVGPEWQNFSYEVDNGDLSRVGATKRIPLNGMNLTIMIGPSPSGGYVASLDSGAAVYKNQQKVMSLCLVLDKQLASDSLKLQCPNHSDAPWIDDCVSGDQVCLECGLVIGERTVYIGSELLPIIEESVSDEELDEKERDLDLNGNVASYEDILGVVTKQKQKVSRSDKTLFEAFETIHTMADRMNLGRSIVDRAYQRFEEVQIGNHLKGHSTDLIAATTLHIACREQGVPQSFDDVCAVSKIKIKELGNCFKRITEALNIKVPPITTTHLMPRFCGNLNLGFPIEKLATHIGIKAVELDIVPGRSPISVAAAAIFMASHALDKKLTKKELGVGTGVAEVTIRLVYKLMHPRAAELFPDSFNLDLTKLHRV